ncbi:MAG: endonuclease/exonuclease/phosphatase family protein [Planctomycetaceae bacterium]
MRCAVVSIVVSAVLATGAGNHGQADETLRVLSYNIHHGRGTDGVVDLQRIADVIRGCEADVVLLQEVDDRTARTGGVDQTAELARLTGLHAAFGRQIDYQGGRYGQAILCRAVLEDPTVHVLPGDPGRETRIAFAARTTLGGRTFTVIGTHLHHLDEPTRLGQARAVGRLDVAPGPAILGGDFNAVPGSEPITAVLETWRSASAVPQATYPAGDPVRQIDYVFSRPADAIEVVACRVLDEGIASDHRPILAVFRIR